MNAATNQPPVLSNRLGQLSWAGQTIDTKSGIGTLLVTDYYSQPMTCSSDN